MKLKLGWSIAWAESTGFTQNPSRSRSRDPRPAQAPAERADTGAHLKHTLGARELGEVHNALDHMVVDEEVLPKRCFAARPKASSISRVAEGLARGEVVMGETLHDDVLQRA